MRLARPLSTIALLLLSAACGGSAAGRADDGGAGGSDEGAGGSGGTGGAAGAGNGNVCGPLAPSSCPEAETFVPCGGDPTGTWVWEAGCAAFPGIPLGSTGIEACDDDPSWYELAYSGTTTFANGIRTDSLQASHVQRWQLDPVCLAASNPGVPADEACEWMTLPIVDWFTGEPIGSQECTSCLDGACGCIARVIPRPVGTAAVSYWIEGAELVAGEWREQFCVEGDRMRLLEWTPDGYPWVVAALRRSP